MRKTILLVLILTAAHLQTDQSKPNAREEAYRANNLGVALLEQFKHKEAADAFRRAGYLDEQFGPLLGHTKSTTTGRYGIMPEGPLRDRVAMIEAIGYSL